MKAQVIELTGISMLELRNAFALLISRDLGTVIKAQCNRHVVIMNLPVY